jgi:DNA gyrase subunit A
VVGPESTILTVCENGYGKRTAVSDYRLTRRGAKGVINIRTTDRNGKVVVVRNVVDEDELMIVSQNGILIRLPIRDISTIGRNTQGVRLINLEEGDRVIDVAKVEQNGEDDEMDEEGDDQTPGGNGKAELE